MGFIGTVVAPLGALARDTSLTILIIAGIASFVILSIVLNVLRQLLVKNPNEPPVVFHWVPFIGSTITYGIDPYKFFFSCREKYGDVFTFILLGKKTTVCLGTKGNDFILNGKLKDVNAEEIYSPLTTPVFGSDVVYDCPNAKLMEQKKFVKFGLTTEALKSYVQLISDEVKAYVKTNPQFQGSSGTFDVLPTMEEITIYTASRSLQGPEVRQKFDARFARLYHDLDMGFSPINFMLPWAPLPHNRARDAAQKQMTNLYMDIIRSRKEKKDNVPETDDMIKNLMACTYKDGTPVPDVEVAHMMIALLMAGQHSSASTSSWIMLRLASKPELWDELHQEQVAVLGEDLPPVTFDTLPKLKLHAQIVKETLRIHAPIHSILRKVKQPLRVEGTPYVIPPTGNLLAAPGVTGRMSEYFPSPMEWEPHRWDEGHALGPTSYGGGPSASAEEEKVDYGYGLVSKGTNSPYLPFGAGRHRCIGEQFAYVQLGVILATLVREFRFRNLDGSREVVGTDYSSLFSRPMAPTVVGWTRRTEDEKS